MVQTLFRRAVLVAVVALVLPVSAAAQTAQAFEADMLARIAKAPNEIGNYLDLVKLYVSLERYDEAQRMLLNAQNVLNVQRTRSQSALFGAVPAVTQVPPRQIDTQAPLRVGGDIKEPRKIKDVKPLYPADALAARLSGIVILEAIIDAAGEVRDAKILRGLPMLNDAALDAVRQWQYTPTTLNGVPVEVIMTVTVNFRLDGGGVSGGYTGPAPVRVGGAIREPRKTKDVAPVYPPIAQAARISGAVILEVIIDADGKVADTQVLRSIPMLNQSALDAVRQWEFEPTYLNGAPVAVVMTMTVSFELK